MQEATEIQEVVPEILESELESTSPGAHWGVLQECNKKIEECLSKDDTQGAIDCVNATLEQALPEEILPILYNRRAAIHFKAGDWENVIVYTTKALEKHPFFTDAVVRRYEAFKTLGRLDEALEDLVLLFFLGKSTEPYSDQMDELLRTLSKREAAELFESRKPALPGKSVVEAFFEDGISDPISKWWTGAVVIPDEGNGDTDLRGFRAAVAALHASDYDRIIEFCSEELENSGSKVKDEALLLRGTMKLLAGCKLEEFFSDLDAVIESETANVELKASAWTKKGCAYSEGHNKEEMIKCFHEADQLMPNNPDLYFQRAIWHIELSGEDNIREAINYVTRALELDPGSARAAAIKVFVEFNIALLNGNMATILQAVKDFQAVLDKFPKSAYAHCTSGHVFKHLEEPYAAHIAYTRASQLEPGNAAYKANSLMTQPGLSVEECLQALTNFLDSGEKVVHIYEHVGAIKQSQGEHEEAIAIMDEGMKCCRTKAELHSLCSLRKAMEVQVRVRNKLRTTPVEAGLASMLLGLNVGAGNGCL